MAPIIPNARSIRAFATAKAFERWLTANHDKAAELYLRIYKKGTGVRTVTYAEALEVALCWGWIDGLRKAHDEESFLQRFSPRKPKSVWSQINRKHVARLIAEARMTPHGLRHVEAAKADGRWKDAYPGSKAQSMPSDLMEAIRAEPRALATFETLNRQNLYALMFRTIHMKTVEGRERKVATLVDMLKRGETPHPNGKKASKKRP